MSKEKISTGFMKRFVLLLFWIACGLTVLRIQAQPGGSDPSAMPKNGVISGKVMDEKSGEFIEYAIVSIYKQKDSSLLTGSITDVRGAFIIKDLPYGMYYIEASFMGYNKLRLNKIMITPQKPALNVGDLKIMPALVNIDAVVVTAESNVVEYKIDKKVVTLGQDMTSAGGTVSQALENTPSIEVDIEGNVTLRGSANFKVLIDGKPSVIQGSDALQQIPASSVQSVEIITNPSAKYDPDGAAGIINLVMKKQKQIGFNGIINASVGTRNKYSTDFLLNVRKEKMNFFLGGEYSNFSMYNEGNSEQRIFSGDTTFYTLSDREGVFHRNGYSVKAGADYYISDKSTVTLQGSLGKRSFDMNSESRFHEYSEPLNSNLYYTEENLSPHANRYYNLSLDYRKEYDNPLHELKASVYFAQAVQGENSEINEQFTDSVWQPIAQNTNLSRSREETPEKNIRAQIDYVYPINENSKIEAGLQSRWDMDNGNYTFENFDPDRGWVNDTTLSNTLDYLDAIQSLYGTFTGKLKKFGYQAGLRAEYDNRYINQVTLSEAYRYEKMHFFPSFYLTYELPKQMQLQISYSRRIERPDEHDLNPFKEYMDNQNVRVGNPGLSPEFTNSFELNYQLPFKKNFISLETFYRRTNNVITHYTEYDTIAGVFIHTEQNADKDFSLGAELMANLNLTRWWQFNLTGNLFRYTLSGENEGEYVTRSTTSWGGNANLVFKLKWDTRIQLMSMYRGPSITLQGERKGFFFTNFAVRKDLFDKRLSVTLNVRDVFRTSKHSSTSSGSGFYTFNEMRRESPVVMLTLSYRINNYKQSKKNGSGSGDDTREMDFEDGM
jgi:outer membrane receptor protein involved in Fe transport